MPLGHRPTLATASAKLLSQAHATNGSTYVAATRALGCHGGAHLYGATHCLPRPRNACPHALPTIVRCYVWPSGHAFHVRRTLLPYWPLAT